MINFLLNENIITVMGVSGFFTTQLLASLKNNILDPMSHHLLPRRMFKRDENFDQDKEIIKWNSFLKDFIIWLILMYIIYLIWKHMKKTKIFNMGENNKKVPNIN